MAAWARPATAKAASILLLELFIVFVSSERAGRARKRIECKRHAIQAKRQAGRYIAYRRIDGLPAIRPKRPAIK
ncbi:hypothetical protein D3872_21030 [Massilia cavernae]|uniref:Uncharacterized protein n=1 Tax=Massilia cavernae TaxID=2320864 RepID=A0A418XF83_9BURK|nr:hypothetical protein D3872_21030 [Massilia cavernae]